MERMTARDRDRMTRDREHAARDRARNAWARARESLDGLSGGRGLNIAHEAVDRHLAEDGGRGVAFRFLAKDGSRREMSFRELAEETNRFANALGSLGVQAGDSIFLLAGRVPKLYVAALRALKARCVVCPLFSAFGPEPIQARMAKGDARVLLTTPALYRRKVAGLRGALPALEHVLLTGSPEEGGAVGAGKDGMRSWKPSWGRRTPSSPSPPPTPRTRPSSTSPAGPPARPRAPSTSTRRWWPTTSPGGPPWISAPTMSSNAPRTPGG